jgi:hypothetical protein
VKGASRKNFWEGIVGKKALGVYEGSHMLSYMMENIDNDS